MKFALIPVNVGVSSVEQMIGMAQAAENAGVESVWTFEHVIVPNDYSSKYPYSPNGKMGTTPETNFVDPLIALTAVAMNTTKLRLGTGVNILSQSNPLFMAKQAASLDMVSNGRFMLGVGIGWLQEEFLAMGTPFEKRGARFDDYLTAMKKAWSGDTVEHQSEFLNWTGFKSYPVPKALDVHIGGSKGKAFERVAKFGQGWFSPTMTPDQIKPDLAKLKDACAAEGRDVSEIEVSSMWMLNDDAFDNIKRFEDLGVSRLICPLFGLGTKNPMDGIAKLGDEVISKL
ncbi:MAG: LLM class F420-dependent oxidoreductase [Proteobacteria bacterium]|jgi:probable F420-dependent oxidoreductase|nr:LLM class F420-dependent oxidoreductase [Pseudomonadota bacterium]MDE0909162.1 LLM class F420-dependent oxidoreductase [Myxococcota bacterium]HIG69233.1 LLM class F420-dependent oxidoreductase [Myxococcales bacterium]HIL99674.1 LLM class F420-dependent oxidoreductase [Myxococcales bacterium]